MSTLDGLTLFDQPLILQTNKISYVIAGGNLLSHFLGDAPASIGQNPPSQMWIASTVTSALGSDTEGLSRVAENLGGFYLKDLIDSAPEKYLGITHSKKWGSNPGYLIKLLNSRERLLVQVHPDKEKAKKYFNSAFGKTEAWYVIDAEDNAAAYAGFKPGVTKERLRAAIVEQDSAKILELLHKFPLAAGDILFIPAGLPHALGEGSLVAEIQEPTDITLRAERKRPSGEILPERMLHAGLGMDILLEFFNYECADYESAGRRIFLKPDTLTRSADITEEILIGYKTTSCFSMNSLSFRPNARLSKKNKSFVVGIVLEGSGCLRANTVSIPLRQGSEYFIPNGVRDYEYDADRGMKLLECYPPLSD